VSTKEKKKRSKILNEKKKRQGNRIYIVKKRRCNRFVQRQKYKVFYKAEGRHLDRWYLRWTRSGREKTETSPEQKEKHPEQKEPINLYDVRTPIVNRLSE